MNSIDISTEEKKIEVYNLFLSFKNKGQIHKYYHISDNSKGCKYIDYIAKEIGFDLGMYNKKEKKFCVECGSEITSRDGKKFCSKSCAAKHNNRNRNSNIKEHNKNKQSNLIKNKKVEYNKCELCGKIIPKYKKFCSKECFNNKKKIDKYNDFIKNNDKYCRGNYTPRPFRDIFLKEQNNKCAICNCNPIHNNKKLVFILDHIDGNAANNKRDNLRLICPNCDSQLDTYKSKNKHSARRNYWKEKIIASIKGD